MPLDIHILFPYNLPHKTLSHANFNRVCVDQSSHLKIEEPLPEAWRVMNRNLIAPFFTQKLLSPTRPKNKQEITKTKNQANPMPTQICFSFLCIYTMLNCQLNREQDLPRHPTSNCEIWNRKHIPSPLLPGLIMVAHSEPTRPSI